MNEYIIAGFTDEMEKRASLGFLGHVAGGALVGAPVEAAMEYTHEDPRYQAAIIRGALKGALAGAAKYQLKKDIKDVMDDRILHVLAGRAAA